MLRLSKRDQATRLDSLGVKKLWGLSGEGRVKDIIINVNCS